MRTVLLPLAVALLAAVSGCSAEAPRIEPQTLPARFSAAQSEASAAAPDRDWYRGFGSQELDRLVQLASAQATDLAAARARVAQADARARQAGAAILPTVEGNATGNYYAGHSSRGGGHEFDWSAMVSASYEVDFWGKNRAIRQSAVFAADAAHAERDTLGITLLAGVASDYFQILALRERIAIAEDNSAAARQLTQVVQARFEVGVASAVELASQKAALATAQIAAIDLRQAETESLSALSLLVGQFPEEIAIERSSLSELQEPAISAGLPSELLARRPDIHVAEANLKAGQADLVAARAALFPALSLTAGAGVANPALPATVLTIPGIGPSFALGGSLLQPIFDHGKLKAQRDEVAAKRLELLASYRAAVIAAFTDVENSLGAVSHLDQSRDAQDSSLAESTRAFDGAKARYEAGSGDFLTLLEAQKTLYAARDLGVQYRLARLNALISLSKALGGGWRQPDNANEAL